MWYLRIDKFLPHHHVWCQLVNWPVLSKLYISFGLYWANNAFKLAKWSQLALLSTQDSSFWWSLCMLMLCHFLNLWSHPLLYAHSQTDSGSFFSKILCNTFAFSTNMWKLSTCPPMQLGTIYARHLLRLGYGLTSLISGWWLLCLPSMQRISSTSTWLCFCGLSTQISLWPRPTIFCWSTKDALSCADKALACLCESKSLFCHLPAIQWTFPLCALWWSLPSTFIGISSDDVGRHGGIMGCYNNLSPQYSFLSSNYHTPTCSSLVLL